MYIILSGHLIGFSQVTLVMWNFYIAYEIQLHYYVLDALSILFHLISVPIHFTEEEFKDQGGKSICSESHNQENKSRF